MLCVMSFKIILLYLNIFQKDFKLMLDNCMGYNHPETIYYKEAQRLLSAGMKEMSKVRHS